MFHESEAEKYFFTERKYLRHLWKEADGERQREPKGSETHQTVDRQDEPAPSLQEREPVGKETASFLHYSKNKLTNA